MMVFRSPQYYKELQKYRREKELRERNNSDQSISLSPGDGQVGRSTGPGLKLQASEDSTANSTRGRVAEPEATSSQAASDKLQAPSNKRQASSRKRQAP